MNSPQSQKLPVASVVMTYTVQAIRVTNQPVQLLIFLKSILTILLVANLIESNQKGKLKAGLSNF